MVLLHTTRIHLTHLRDPFVTFSLMLLQQRVSTRRMRRGEPSRLRQERSRDAPIDADSGATRAPRTLVLQIALGHFGERVDGSDTSSPPCEMSHAFLPPVTPVRPRAGSRFRHAPGP